METSLTDEFIGQRLENYVIERLLGAGGMANVYQARDTLHGREVAIKALSPVFLTDPGYVERFRREAHHIAALEHPSIVPMLQFIERDAGLYVVMPLYAESLRDLLDRKQRLPLNEVVRIVTEVGSALAVAHSHGLVHRDVKPENILLDAHGARRARRFWYCAPGDLQGKFRRSDARCNRPTSWHATIHAARTIAGDWSDHRADIYALGVVLYETLTGRTPHVGSSPLEVAAVALTQPVIPPSRLNSEVTAPVEAVILSALSARAEDRYANVKSFIESFQEALQGSAQSAVGPTLPIAWPSSNAPSQVESVGHGQHGRAWWRNAALSALALLGGEWWHRRPR